MRVITNDQDGVDEQNSESGKDGDTMRATVRFHKMGAERKSPRGDEDERGALKGELMKAHDASAEHKDSAAARGGKKFTDKK